jgi:hypothetical protein
MFEQRSLGLIWSLVVGHFASTREAYLTYLHIFLAPK